MRIAPLRLLVAALGTVVTVGTFAQPQSERVPAFLISIPQNVNPALTQIHYFLTGPFGGYGGFVRTEADRFHYPIPTVQDGAPATVLKLIAYMPGCQITTMTDVLTASSRSRDIECAPLATVRLACRIEGNVAFTTKPYDVQVDLLAVWSHTFFGIADGLIDSIRIARITPDQYGGFSVELPDLTRDPVSQSYGLHVSAFTFRAREQGTLNNVGRLEPINIIGSGTGGPLRPNDWLRPESTYPDEVVFRAIPPP